MLTWPKHVLLTRDAVTNLVCLGLCSCLLLWPVTLGIGSHHLRFLWLAIAVTGVSVATASVRRALRTASTYTLPLPSAGWTFATLAGISLFFAMYSIVLPPFTFSDEINIMLPGFTLARRVMMIVGAPALMVLTLIGGIFGIRWCVRSGTSGAYVIIMLASICGLGVAAMGPTTGLALRYPPLIHVLQTLSTVFTAGDAAWFRAPNIFWTLLLCWGAWLLPASTRWQKAAFVLGVILGPLGWMHRLLLYQVCGELTLGAFAILSLAWAMREKDEPMPGVLYGVTCAFWMLYRPTALAPILCGILLLLLSKRWRAAIASSSIVGPIAAVWMSLSPIFASQYHLLQDAAGQTELPSIFVILQKVISALPLNFHPVGLTVIVLGSALALVHGTPFQRTLIVCGWLMAGANALPQQMLAGNVYFGIARLNALLLLPGGFALATLMGKGRLHLAGAATAIVGIIGLAAITPWNIMTYAQQARLPHAPTVLLPAEGFMPTPLLASVKTLTKEKRDFAVVAKEGAYLDLLVSDGTLTPGERETVMRRSASWTPEHPTVPVIIRAPVRTSYAPNLTIEEETLLRSARAWAQTQKHETVQMGLEEVVIVR